MCVSSTHQGGVYRSRAAEVHAQRRHLTWILDGFVFLIRVSHIFEENCLVLNVNAFVLGWREGWGYLR